MYKYGISYYKMESGAKVPHSGLNVRLLRPGQTWPEGIVLAENQAGSGHYDVNIEDAEDCGYYEIWDDLGGSGAFSGRSCIIGQLDARGLQDACIYGNHIDDGAVTESKIGVGAINLSHLSNVQMGANKLAYEAHNQDNGIGDVSLASPAVLGTDKYISHIFSKEYTEEPLVIFTNKCGCFMYVYSVSLMAGELTVNLAAGSNDDATDFVYDLVVISK